MAAALQRLGSRHALVVHGNDGVDELSISGTSSVQEIRDGEITEYSISPEDAGLSMAAADAIRGGTPEQNAAVLAATLKGEPGPIRDVVVLNAAAALMAADAVRDPRDGARLAADAIDSAPLPQAERVGRDDAEVRIATRRFMTQRPRRSSTASSPISAWRSRRRRRRSR
jgi:anthranilate phosphoribosyltransferase